MTSNKLLRVVFIISIAFSIAKSSQFKDCNFTDYRFQSNYNLGKQDQLNNTFDAMNDNFSVPNVLYPVNSYTNYSLTNIKTTFSYIDSKQKSQVIGNDTIVIAGGYLQAYFTMDWGKKDFLQIGGSIQAMCKSDEIIFAKNLTIQRGYLIYQVQQYYDVTFRMNDCKILRYQPANISELDLKYITQMVNKRQDDKQTVKSLNEIQINKKFLFYLNQSLYNQKHQLDDTFYYQWTDKNKGEIMSIQYEVLPTGVDLEKQGLSFTFVTQIKDYDGWKCGNSIPYKNLDIKTYGGIQQFLSLSVFQNTLRYGIQKGALNTVLNRASWQSKMFQFFAGDLYEVIPYISTKYAARQQITGTCKGISQNVNIVPQQLINQFMARTGHVCQLFIQNKTKILQIQLDIYSHIEAKFQEEAKVNFYLKNLTHSLSYREQSEFKIENYQLANSMLQNTLNNLKQMRVFGSGWPTYKMDYPHMKVMGGAFVVFYDTSTLQKNNEQIQNIKEKEL